MAQFAVNLVDALDSDSNITVFEYDKDLSDGWNLDDNAYDGLADPIIYATLPLDRGVVYGVERQQLCLNEAMVTLSQQCMNTVGTTAPVDHPDTQWHDQDVWSFLYLELENVGPTTVDFNNAQWQIAVKPSPIVTAPTTSPGYPFYGGGALSATGEMRLILTSVNAQGGSTLLSVAPGTMTSAAAPSSRLTIGGMIGSSTGAVGSFNIINTTNPTSTTPHPSYMVLNPNDQSPDRELMTHRRSTTTCSRLLRVRRLSPPNPSGGPYTNATVLTAAAGGLDLIDNVNQGNNYWVVPPSTAANAGSADGMNITAASLGGIAPGSQLLQFNDQRQRISCRATRRSSCGLSCGGEPI